jgi:integrase
MSILVQLDKNSEVYQNFINSLRTQATQLKYSISITDFLNWVHSRNEKMDSFTALVSHADSSPKTLKAEIIQYLRHLKEDKNLSSSSRNSALSAIKHFYEMNDIALPWHQIAKFIGEYEVENEDREYTYEEIAKQLEIADLKYKVIILIMASAGLRIGAVPEMKYDHISKVSDYDIYKISVYKRSREEYYTFCTPECYKVISSYLQYRERSGEKLTPHSPLIRDDFDPTDTLRVRRPKSLTLWTIMDKLRQIRIRAAVAEYHPITETNRVGVRRNKVQGNHGFRKFAITQMGRSKMDSEIREMLAGHKLGVRGLYLKYGEQDKLTEYLKAVNFLTISQENMLKVENLKIKQRNETLERDKDEVILLRKELEPLLALKDTLIKEGLLKES